VPSVPLIPASSELSLKNILRQVVTGFADTDELPIRHRAKAFTKFRQFKSWIASHDSLSQNLVGPTEFVNCKLP
jgi:hypothetical protein